MEKLAERFTIWVPHGLGAVLAQAPSEYFVGVSSSEMFQDLIHRGLDVTHLAPGSDAVCQSLARCTADPFLSRFYNTVSAHTHGCMQTSVWKNKLCCVKEI